MKRGDVCRDKVTGCDGCKKNEYIEVVVRCSQGKSFQWPDVNPELLPVVTLNRYIIYTLRR